MHLHGHLSLIQKTTNMRFTKADGFSRGEKCGVDRPSILLDFVGFLEPYKDVFHKLFRLCKISVVIPVSTASFERRFSAFETD